MLENATKPLKLALHGMDSRAVKVMMKFLHGSCTGAAIVVNSADDADIDIFDADVPVSKNFLEKCLQESLLKPLIVLSTQDFIHEGVLYLKKPIETNDMLMVLEQAKILADEFVINANESGTPLASKHVEHDFMDFFNDELFDHFASSTWADDPISKKEAIQLRTVLAPDIQEPEPHVPHQVEHNIRSEEAEQVEEQPEPLASSTLASNQHEDQETFKNQHDTSFHSASVQQDIPEITESMLDETEIQVIELSKHQAAMQEAENSFNTYLGQNEKGFYDYIGAIDDVDLNDPLQIINAAYNPKNYFQGYFQIALASCQAKNQPIMLQSDWCPIALLPFTQEVWLDARDSELKAFAEIRLKHKAIATEITAIPIDPKMMNLGGTLDKFHSMDSFSWKLACWTSKGRYPEEINYKLPVYLKHWPNFTQFLITPHALRIAALLIKGPRTMVNVAETLNIKPQYVFVFISAACAVGLADQGRRLADNLVQPPEVAPSKSQGLLGHFAKKMRRNKT
jgi:hypothetical protein